MMTYLSFGGGVNSVAMHLLMLDEGIDFESVFVHHGTDWPETYDYLAGFQWWLKANGHRPVTILRTTEAGVGTVIEYCEQYSMTPSTRQRWCTDRFKVRVLHRHFQRPAFVCVGIDAGESRRAKISTEAGIENRYPLIERDINRAGCIEIIKAHGLPAPIKSGCYICPYQKRQ